MNDHDIERWLRSKIREDEAVAPDSLRLRTLDEVARTTQRGARPSPLAAMASISVAVAAAVVVLAIIVPLLERDGPRVGEPTKPAPAGTPVPSPTRTPSPAGTLDPGAFAPDVAAVYEVGRRSGALAAIDGDVWMVSDIEPYYLRLDPNTGAVTEFSLGTDSGPGAEMDADAGMIWASVSTTDFGPDRLVRIDPISGEMAASVDIGATYPRIGAGYVWALLGMPEDRGTTIVQVDPASNDVVRQIEMPGECDEGHMPTGLGVWCIGSGAAFRIDPETGAVEAQPDLALGHPVVEAAGLIWGLNSDERTVWAIDPVAGTVVAQLPMPDDVELLPDAVAVEGRIWWTGHGSGARTPILLEVDLEAQQFGRTLLVAEPNYHITTDGSSIYLPVLRTPFVARIDP